MSACFFAQLIDLQNAVARVHEYEGALISAHELELVLEDAIPREVPCLCLSSRYALGRRACVCFPLVRGRVLDLFQDHAVDCVQPIVPGLSVTLHRELEWTR